MIATTSVVPVAPSAPTLAFDTAAVRELLMAAFGDEEFTAFCYDNFPPAYDVFSVGMSRPRKTQILMEHCERQGRTEELLAKIERANPYRYEQFKARLRNGALSPDPTPGLNPPLNPSADVTGIKDPTRSVSHKTERKRLRKLPMAAFIEADRKARFGKEAVEPPKPEEPKEEPKEQPKWFADGPQPPDSWKPEPPKKEEEPQEEVPVVEPPVITTEPPIQEPPTLINSRFQKTLFIYALSGLAVLGLIYFIGGFITLGIGIDPICWPIVAVGWVLVSFFIARRQSVERPEPPKEKTKEEPASRTGGAILMVVSGILVGLVALLAPMSNVATQIVGVVFAVVLLVGGITIWLRRP